MTRINCIPVQELTDKHLLAEYRELPRISTLAHKWATKNEVGDNLPSQYTLGKGHVKFFYDKGAYLLHRFENEIVPEMQKRGFKTNFTKYRMHPEDMNKNWLPTSEAIEINIARINERLNKRRD